MQIIYPLKSSTGRYNRAYEYFIGFASSTSYVRRWSMPNDVVDYIQIYIQDEETVQGPDILKRPNSKYGEAGQSKQSTCKKKKRGEANARVYVK
jgi:hypothetical protein